MTTPPTRLVWDTLGRPDPVPSAAALLDQPGTCRMCGLDSDRTAPAKKALGANWTDHTCWRQPGSDRVCDACLWVCSGKPPATVRMWTVVATPGTPQPPSGAKAPWDAPDVCLTNRGNTRPIIKTLTNPPVGEWLASIAVSGQKHILPYGTVNHTQTNWSVRYEDTTITATPDLWAHVHTHTLALRRLGLRDTDILTGQPGPLRTPEDLATWRDHATRLTPHHGAPLLRLALWTITKEITNDHDTYPA